MGTTVETISPAGKQVPYRQTISPNYLAGSFVADDTDNHDFKFAGQGKGRLELAVDNPANQDAVITIYGMSLLTGTVADAGVFYLDTFTVSAVEDKEIKQVTQAFPFYLVRIAYGVAPNDNPLKTCSLYANLSGS